MALYHYCSNTTLISILQTRQLRLSELSLSNDPMEGRWIRNVFRECCTERNVPVYQQDQLERRLNVVINMFGAVGFCMSHKDDLLSQWRAYADKGRGVAIGFDPQYFSVLGAQRRDRQELFGVQLEEVKYDSASQKLLIHEPLDLILESVSEGALAPLTLIAAAAEGGEAAHRQRQFSLALRFLPYFPHLFKIKNPAFAEEHEWRAISHLIQPSIDEPQYLKQLLFHAGRDRIVPYIPIDLEPLSVQSITEVVVGPRNITPTPVIERMLRALKWENVTVRRSGAIYR